MCRSADRRRNSPIYRSHRPCRVMAGTDQPDRGYAKPVQIVETPQQASEIADAVAVGIHIGADGEQCRSHRCSTRGRLSQVSLRRSTARIFAGHVIIGEPAASSHHFKTESDHKRERYDRFWREADMPAQPGSAATRDCWSPAVKFHATPNPRAAVVVSAPERAAVGKRSSGRYALIG